MTPLQAIFPFGSSNMRIGRKRDCAWQESSMSGLGQRGRNCWSYVGAPFQSVDLIVSNHFEKVAFKVSGVAQIITERPENILHKSYCRFRSEILASFRNIYLTVTICNSIEMVKEKASRSAFNVTMDGLKVVIGTFLISGYSTVPR